MKNRIRKAIDIVLTALLLCLMAHQVTGESGHEWVGIGMSVLLIVHHILNIRWYAVLFKGKYNAFRIVTTVVNALLLASIALTSFCGMSMSVYAVPFLYGMANMVFVRTAHLAMSYWSFILMGVHLGLHLPAMTASLRPGKAAKAICTVLFAAVSGLGLWLFIRSGATEYITFRTHFAFIDYDKAAALVFLENLAELFFFTFLGANLCRCLRSRSRKKDLLISAACILLSVLVAVVLNMIPGKGSSTVPDWDAPENAAPVSQDAGLGEIPEHKKTEVPT